MKRIVGFVFRSSRLPKEAQIAATKAAPPVQNHASESSNCLPANRKAHAYQPRTTPAAAPRSARSSTSRSLWRLVGMLLIESAPLGLPPRPRLIEQIANRNDFSGPLADQTAPASSFSRAYCARPKAGGE